MKLVTFVDDARPETGERVGAVIDNGESIVDLASAAETIDGHCPDYFASMLALLDGAQQARDHAERLIEVVPKDQQQDHLRPKEAVRLLAPVPRPRSIRDCMSFENHLINAMRTVAKWKSRPAAALDRSLSRLFGKGFLRPPKVWYERPIYYKGNPHSVVGPDADVLWPAYTERFDFELEFGVFIGRKGRDIPTSDAMKYVAGYTIFNDFSARDVQIKEMQGRLGPAKGKDFDTGNALGPYLVTPDEISDPEQLTTEARVNGEVWSGGSTSELHHSFEEMIAFISQDETLFPGDFIAAGTIPGGCGLELDRWLKPDDVVELEVEGLGILKNRVVRRT